MGIWLWSRTAASNDVADPAINLREGMAPSEVNNSARATLAALASYRDDMSGAKETGGANSAYTLSTYGSVVDDSTDYLDNVCVSFTAHATNATNPTLNVDSGGALPLRGLSGIALGAGVLVEGTPYQALLSPAKDEWIILGFRTELSTIPLGGFVPYCGTSAPNSQFVLPYGQALSRSTYADLFTLCGTTFGVGDGSTTFNVPDLRGRVVAGLDNMGGSAASRITTAGSSIDGTARGAAGGAQFATIARNQLPNVQPTISITDPGHTHTVAGVVGSSSTGLSGGANSAPVSPSGTSAASNTTGITATCQSLNGGVAQVGLVTQPPTIILPYIMRVL